MKFVSDRLLNNPDVAARTLVDFANATEVVQDGRIHIKLVNAQFLKAGGTPDQYREGLAGTARERNLCEVLSGGRRPLRLSKRD